MWPYQPLLLQSIILSDSSTGHCCYRAPFCEIAAPATIVTEFHVSSMLSDSSTGHCCYRAPCCEIAAPATVATEFHVVR
ncbi:hypothetical protein RRG08_065261 [Elysia crispata]|uniref:Uncharacterized protein n=1 Tax=Elysia crispata TaxID=231223 RepID=A0AAE0Z2J6_9GAST|nr:hypothetical protein RRG08_065261 [Elysia crispata]